MKGKFSIVLQLIILFFSTSKFKIFNIDADKFSFILLLVFLIYILFICFFNPVSFKLNKKIFKHTIIASLFLIVFLPLNLISAQKNGINYLQWLSEAYFLCLIPILFLIFNLTQSLFGLKNLFYPLLIMGAFELCLIYLSAINEGFDTRATHFLGVYVMSHLIYFFEYWVLYYQKNFILKLFLFVLIIFALILTGSRMAFLCGLLVAIPFIIKNKAMTLMIICVSLFFIAVEELPLLQRQYNLEEDLSSVGKYSEVLILWEWFLENPFFGKGIGLFYNNGVDLSDFNYSHNMYFWFLGYTGIFMTTYFMYLIFTSLFKYYKSLSVLFIPILLYYFSSTTFTTLKFIFFILAFFIVTKLDKKYESIFQNKK